MIRVAVCVSGLAASVCVAQTIGPSTASEPYALPSAPGVKTVSVLTVGEGPSGYRMVGKPDGLGAYANPDGTFTLLMNHELGTTEGIARRHGARGALVSEWTIAPDLTVLTARDLIHTTNAYDRTAKAYVTGPVVFNRFCSGDLAPPSAFLFGSWGTGSRIYLNGEESRPPFSVDFGRAFAHVIDSVGAESFELPWMGRMSFENALASPFPQRKTIVMGTDDASSSTGPNGTPSELYMYVGTKQSTGTPIERAGLVGGSLYGLRLVGAVSGETTAFGFGSGSYVGTARFTLENFGDVSNRSGTQLQTESIQRSLFRFQRIEDGAWDPRPGFGNDFYFATTGSSDPISSRVFRVRFDDILQPELGGEITILLIGTEGHRSLDNMAMDRYGHLLLQEDTGSSLRLARIWQLDVNTLAFKQLARTNPNFFTPRQPGFLTSNEESSGIIDASPFLGPGWFLFDVQAHYPNGNELDEGGQLLALFNPDSLCPVDLNADGVLDTGDISAFVQLFLQSDPAADMNNDGIVDNGDIGVFVQLFLSGCGRV